MRSARKFREAFRIIRIIRAFLAIQLFPVKISPVADKVITHTCNRRGFTDRWKPQTIPCATVTLEIIVDVTLFPR